MNVHPCLFLWKNWTINEQEFSLHHIFGAIVVASLSNSCHSLIRLRLRKSICLDQNPAELEYF
jgi:hypothetical protein